MKSGNNRKYLNCELNKVFAERFKTFLKQQDIKYEASSAWCLVHFEYLVNDEEAQMCDDFIAREFYAIQEEIIMTWNEKQSLREDILLLKQLERWLLENGTPHKESLDKLADYKRRIRQKLKDIYARDEEREIVICVDEHGDGYIIKEWYDKPFSDEDKKEYAENNCMHIHSAFDCTGLSFTKYIRIFNVETSFGARAVIYHAIGRDV